MVISQWMDVPGRRIPLEYDCPRHCRAGVSSEIYDEAIKRQHGRPMDDDDANAGNAVGE